MYEKGQWPVAAYTIHHLFKIYSVFFWDIFSPVLFCAKKNKIMQEYMFS